MLGSTLAPLFDLFLHSFLILFGVFQQFLINIKEIFGQGWTLNVGKRDNESCCIWLLCLCFLISPCVFALSATGNETRTTFVKLMPMVDGPKLNFFSQGYHIIYSNCWQNNHHQGKESHHHVKRSKWYGPKVLLILLLLSGNIQMNPGPSIYN